jgi:hypothetical protein
MTISVAERAGGVAIARSAFTLDKIVSEIASFRQPEQSKADYFRFARSPTGISSSLAAHSERRLRHREEAEKF